MSEGEMEKLKTERCRKGELPPPPHHNGNLCVSEEYSLHLHTHTHTTGQGCIFWPIKHLSAYKPPIPHFTSCVCLSVCVLVILTAVVAEETKEFQFRPV